MTIVELAAAAFSDVLTVVVGLVALAVLVRTKLNSAWLIAGGVLIGIGHAALA